MASVPAVPARSIPTVRAVHDVGIEAFFKKNPKESRWPDTFGIPYCGTPRSVLCHRLFVTPPSPSMGPRRDAGDEKMLAGHHVNQWGDVRVLELDEHLCEELALPSETQQDTFQRVTYIALNHPSRHEWLRQCAGVLPAISISEMALMCYLINASAKAPNVHIIQAALAQYEQQTPGVAGNLSPLQFGLCFDVLLTALVGIPETRAQTLPYTYYPDLFRLAKTEAPQVIAGTPIAFNTFLDWRPLIPTTLLHALNEILTSHPTIEQRKYAHRLHARVRTHQSKIENAEHIAEATLYIIANVDKLKALQEKVDVLQQEITSAAKQRRPETEEEREAVFAQWEKDPSHRKPRPTQQKEAPKQHSEAGPSAVDESPEIQSPTSPLEEGIAFVDGHMPEEDADDTRDWQLYGKAPHTPQEEISPFNLARTLLGSNANANTFIGKSGKLHSFDGHIFVSTLSREAFSEHTRHWDPGTFPSPAHSVAYHLEKHGKPGTAVAINDFMTSPKKLPYTLYDNPIAGGTAQYRQYVWPTKDGDLAIRTTHPSPEKPPQVLTAFYTLNDPNRDPLVGLEWHEQTNSRIRPELRTLKGNEGKMASFMQALWPGVGGAPK